MTVSRCKKLAREETQALVRAMESRVEKVLLYNVDELDMEALSKYSGQGRCRVLECKGVTDITFCYELMTWAQSKGWYYLNLSTYELYDAEEEDWILNHPESADVEKIEKFRIVKLRFRSHSRSHSRSQVRSRSSPGPFPVRS